VTAPPAFVPLETKLHAPRLPERLIARPRLVAALRRNAPGLVVFSAPAGAGKTSVIREWLEEDGRPWAWLHLDHGDNDPVVLLEYLARALLRVSPLDPRVLGWLELPEPPVRRVILPALVAAASAAPAFVLVLDDAHAVRDPRCWQILAALAEAIAAQSSLVVSSRSDPPLPLSRLRSQGALAEYGLHDLAFDLDETRAVLALHGFPVTGEEWPAAVHEATEGWAAGVYLTVLWSHGRRPPSLPTPSGDRREIAEYLIAEVLDEQPPDMIEFLTRTAVVDRLSSPLCDELVGRPGSADVLEALLHDNLFLLPLDDHREWFRYHHLFRELLLAELEHREPRAAVALHRTAARWFEREGQTSDVLRHLMAAGDVARAAEVAAAGWWPYYLGGRIWTARRWLELFTSDQIAEHIPLRIAAAWIHALTGDAGASRSLITGLDPASLDSSPSYDRAVSPRSSLALLSALLASDGPFRMREDALEAVRREEGGTGPWTSFAWLVLGVAEVLCGDDDAAVGPLRRAAAQAKLLRNGIDLSALGNLSLLAGDAGRWEEAAEYAVEAAARAGAYDMDEYLPSALARLARDRLCAREGDADAIADLEDLVEQTSPDFCPWVSVRACLLLAEARLAIAETGEAARLLRQARATLSRWAPAPGLTRRVERLEHLVFARVLVEPPSPAELRVLGLLPTNLTAAEIAERLGVSPNTVGTHIKSLHRKLGATRRSEVVERSVALGLLPAGEPPPQRSPRPASGH
jgi:LuxR family maltose regulon positive regulatory protein